MSTNKEPLESLIQLFLINKEKRASRLSSREIYCRSHISSLLLHHMYLAISNFHTENRRENIWVLTVSWSNLNGVLCLVGLFVDSVVYILKPGALLLTPLFEYFLVLLLFPYLFFFLSFFCLTRCRFLLKKCQDFWISIKTLLAWKMHQRCSLLFQISVKIVLVLCIFPAASNLAKQQISIQIQLKTLAEEMQAVSKGLEKVEQELTEAENDGPISEAFGKVSNTISCLDFGVWNYILAFFWLHVECSTSDH